MSSTPVSRQVRLGVLLYLGYLAIFFTVWTVNRVDYTRIGEDVATTKLWYALPTMAGCAFLIFSITLLGWWRVVLFDRVKSGPGWVWILPAVMALIIVNNFLRVPAAELSAALLLWSALGALGVGFGEEVATRGRMLVGLRSALRERYVWLFSTLSFAALHVPNVFFGLPGSMMAVQVVLTFIMGSAFYVMRRLSGTLLLPMALHGLWDSSLFLQAATGVTPSPVQFAVYPLAIVCTIVVLFRDRSPE
jgi:membrane protease YdiL (CAAX protease family)